MTVITKDMEAAILWGHLIARHGAELDSRATLEEMIDLHDDEHDGPCTIRNHDRDDLRFDAEVLADRISEMVNRIREELADFVREENPEK